MTQHLEANGSYLCPACRHGQIQTLALMDVFGCNFCRNLFEVNLSQQTLHLAGTNRPMGWQWTGSKWRSLSRQSEIGSAIWILSAGLVLLPASLVAGSAYMFPPLEGSVGARWPWGWALATLATHGGLAAWLLVEHYQLPAYTALKAWLRQVRQPG